MTFKFSPRLIAYSVSLSALFLATGCGQLFTSREVVKDNDAAESQQEKNSSQRSVFREIEQFDVVVKACEGGGKPKVEDPSLKEKKKKEVKDALCNAAKSKGLDALFDQADAKPKDGSVSMKELDALVKTIANPQIDMGLCTVSLSGAAAKGIMKGDDPDPPADSSGDGKLSKEEVQALIARCPQ